MPIAGGEVKGVISASQPTDDTTPPGGAKTSIQVINALSSWFTRLSGNPTGALDTDAITEYQKLFVQNDSAGSTAENVLVYIANGLSPILSNGAIKILSTEPSTTKFWIYGEAASGSIGLDAPVSLGTGAEITGAISFANRLFLVWAASTADDSVIPVGADVTIKDNAGNILGYILADSAYAVGCLQIGGPNTEDDTGTSANRLTAPAGISFTAPNTPAAGIPARNDAMNSDLLPGVGWAVWGAYTQQPGVPPEDVDIFIAIQFDSGP